MVSWHDCYAVHSHFDKLKLEETGLDVLITFYKPDRQLQNANIGIDAAVALRIVDVSVSTRVCRQGFHVLILRSL